MKHHRENRGRQAMPIVALTLTGLACGPEVPLDAEREHPFERGERLSPVVYDAGDGARVFARWHDQHLGLDCEVLPARDGTLRCVPGVYDYAIYTDPSCSEPVYRAQACGELPRAVRRPVAVCPGDVEYESYRVGAAMGEHPVYSRHPQGCTPLGTAEIHALEPIRPNDMVAFDVRVEQHGIGLDRVIHRGEDGSHAWAHVRDSQVGRRCEAWGWWTDDPQCIAVDRAVISDTYRTDSSCASGVVATYPAGCAEPVVAVRTDDAELFELGGRLDPSEVFVESLLTGSCEPLDSSHDELLSVGPKVGSGAFPSIDIGSRGTGRLRALFIQHPSGSEMAPSSLWWDDELGMHCEIRETHVGPRCLPIHPMGYVPVAPILWGDAGCSQTMVAALPSDVEGVNARVTPPDISKGSCAEGDVIRLGEPYDGPVHFRRDDGQCAEGTRLPHFAYRLVERRVAIEDLPTLQITTE